ncbi:MAG: IPT/TIG domain-containing protein [Acidobacteria bacterium]|nr:IPT/TIG domain-containing protein [Acidobacteriota bacterium]
MTEGALAAPIAVVETLEARRAYLDKLGSARVTYWKAEGTRKGVFVGVFGFNPVPRDDCDNPRVEKELDLGGIARTAWDMGFDVYFVFWCNGGDYIQRNAFVLMRLMEDIRAAGLGPSEKVFVFGSSMGGLVSRYTLVRMETEGNPHEVDLFITFDSPHRGAYIPLAVQYTGRYFRDLTELARSVGVTLPDRPELRTADVPAARQMLLLHHSRPLASTPHDDFNRLFDELRSLYGDYPNADGMRTVAIASGSGMGRVVRRLGNLKSTFVLADSTKNIPINISVPLIGSWSTTLTLTYLATVELDVTSDRPTTQEQTVLRASQLIQDTRINGIRIFSTGPQTIASDLRRILSIPSWIPDIFLQPFANTIANFIQDLFAEVSGVQREFRVVIPLPYESSAAGLGGNYEAVEKALRREGDLRRTLPRINSFIPTTSALGLDLPPDTDLRDISNLATPFSRVLYQTVDTSHGAGTREANSLLCQELHGLVGLPHITGMDPQVRAPNSGKFDLTVHGANFSETTSVLWDGREQPTTFVSSAEIFASIPAEDLEESALMDLPPFQIDLRSGLPWRQLFISLADPRFQSGVTGCQAPLRIAPPDLITIGPSAPDMNEEITVLLFAIWGSTPPPHVTGVIVSGNRITVESATPEFGFFVQTPYSLEVRVGPLAVGDYEVEFINNNATSLGSRVFTVIPPEPAIATLTPAATPARGGDFILTVDGFNFVNGFSSVQWNGADRSTTFVSNSQLRASISASDIMQEGTAEVSVRNLERSGPESALFTITVPQPSLSGLMPASALPGSPDLILTVSGSNFTPSSVVLWTGLSGGPEPRETRFLGDNQLEAVILASDLRASGAYPVAVLEEAGGMSEPLTFVIESGTSALANPPIIAATVEGAGFQPGISPGSIASLFGFDFSASTASADTVPLPTTLAAVRVTVNGVNAPLYFVSPGQINIQVPFETPLGSDVPIVVIRDEIPGPEWKATVELYALGVFTYEREPGVRDPIITHADGRLVTPSDPARPGEVVIVYGTGIGGLENPPPTGAASLQEPLATSLVEPQVILTGSSSEAAGRSLFVGLAPGFVGLIQMNIQLPDIRPPDAELKLGVRFREEDQFLLVPIPVAQN